MAKKTHSNLTVDTLTHTESTRKSIPTAEYQSVMQKDDLAPGYHVPINLYWHCWNLNSKLLKQLTRQLIVEIGLLLAG